MYRTPEFTAAVEGVLDAREEKRRQQRLEKQAERMAQQVLRDLEVTDGQKADFQRLTLDYLLRRDEIRRDQQASEEERRARAETLDQERTASLSALFDDTQMEAIQKRMRRVIYAIMGPDPVPCSVTADGWAAGRHSDGRACLWGVRRNGVYSVRITARGEQTPP